MGYKMRMGKLSMDNTPIYQLDLEDGIMGQANRNGSIALNSNLDPNTQKDVIKHEKIHLNQMSRGDLDYDDKYVYWKGKKHPRSSMDEGNKKLPWEKEAYNKTNKK